jgi:hypothetical protein
MEESETTFVQALPPKKKTPPQRVISDLAFFVHRLPVGRASLRPEAGRDRFFSITKAPQDRLFHFGFPDICR